MNSRQAQAAIEYVKLAINDTRTNTEGKTLLLEAAKVNAILALAEAVEKLAQNSNRPGNRPPPPGMMKV